MQHLAYGAFDAPELLPFMNIRRAFDGLRVWAGPTVFALPLCGCAAGTVADIVSVGASGKPIVDHVLDVVTGEDCSLFRGIFHSERHVCEPRETEVATRDIPGPSRSVLSVEGPVAEPYVATGPSDDPGGSSGSDPY